MRVDRLTIDAVVNDDFTSTLGDLTDQLLSVDRVASQTIRDITADVDIAKAMTEVQTLKSSLRDVDDVSATVNTDADDGIFADFDPAERATAADLIGPTQFQRNSSSSSGGETASADGGDSNRTSLRRLIRSARGVFGDAFDPTAIANDPERVTRLTDLLGDDPSEFIDEDALATAILDGSVDEDIITNLRGSDIQGNARAYRELRRNDLTSLPTEGRMLEGIRKRLDPFTDAIQDFDATALNNLRASLFPLLATFIGALPAAIAGVAALGGAALAAAATLGAVGAIGAIGVVVAEDQSLSDLASELKDEFLDAFAPIGEQLRPTFMEGIDSLNQFFDDLAQRASVLTAFSDDAVQFQKYLETYVLNGFENLIGFASVAIDLFDALGSEMGDFTITGVLAGVLDETIDEIRLVGQAIWNLLPTILRLSEGFFKVIGVMLTLIGVVGLILNEFPLITKIIGAAAATFLTLASAVLISTAVTRLFSAALFQSAFAAGKSMITSLVSAASTLNVYTVSALGATAGTLAFYGILVALLGVISLGIIPAIGTLSSKFSVLGGDIHSARKELERFSSVSASGNVGEFTASRGGRGSGYTNYVDQSQTTIVAPDDETGGTVSNRHKYDQSVANQHIT